MYFSSTIISPASANTLVITPGSSEGPVSLPYVPSPIVPSNKTGLIVPSNINYVPLFTPGAIITELMIERGQLYLDLFGRYIDFGLVLVDTSFTISITNRTVDLAIITDISWLSDIGVETTLEVDTTIARNQTVTFDIKAFATEGRPVVDSVFVITFDNGSTMLIDLYILRASSLIYSIIPDRRTYSESYTYKTEVVEFTSGVESRRQLLSTPKMNFEYETTLSNQAITEYSKSVAHLSMYTPFAQPLWLYRIEITGGHPSSNIIEFDTTDIPYKIGGYCAVIQDQIYPVLLRVIAITSTSIQVNVPFQMEGSFWVLPAIPVYNSTTLSNTYDTHELNSMSYKLSEF